LGIKIDRIAANYGIRSGLEKRYSMGVGEFKSIWFAIFREM
jgi:hypothetical protein